MADIALPGLRGPFDITRQDVSTNQNNEPSPNTGYSEIVGKALDSYEELHRTGEINTGDLMFLRVYSTIAESFLLSNSVGEMRMYNVLTNVMQMFKPEIKTKSGYRKIILGAQSFDPVTFAKDVSMPRIVG